MMTGLDISVTKPDDEIRPRMGGNGGIPIIGFGPGDSSCTAQIVVNHHCLTPVEQAAWLRKLAAAAEELAKHVEKYHGKDSVAIQDGTNVLVSGNYVQVVKS